MFITNIVFVQVTSLTPGITPPNITCIKIQAYPTNEPGSEVEIKAPNGTIWKLFAGATDIFETSSNSVLGSFTITCPPGSLAQYVVFN